MVRPCYLVVDVEHGGSISTRKLVLETAKLNVITAYSGVEAVQTLEKFPGLDGAIVDAAMQDIPCGELVGKLKAIKAGLPVIVVGSPQQWQCDGAEHYLESFDPARLLELLKTLMPRQIEAILAQDAGLTEAGR